MRTAVFLMSCIYGSRQFGNKDQERAAHFILSALRNRNTTMYGDGKQVRVVFFVGDMTEACSAFLESRLKGGLFNIGGSSENTLSLLELVKRIESMTGRRPDISFDESRNSDQKVYISDTRHAVKQLGCKPKVGVENGFLRLFNRAASA